MVKPTPLRAAQRVAQHPTPYPPQHTAQPQAGAVDGGTAPASLRFGRFELRSDERLLLVDGRPAPLQAKALDLLIVLAARAGQLIRRQTLLDLVWPGLAVEENNLSVQINALRKVLGADTIATVPARGYRFAALVDGAAPGTGAAATHDAAVPGSARTERVVQRTHLPAILEPLIGRDAELLALGEKVDRHPLVTITGAGGIGKTRLAQALLHARQATYRHGVCFVELASVSEPDAVPPAIAAALGLRLPEGGNAGSALARAIAPLHLLIAIDNAEHLQAAVAAVVKDLLAAAPTLRLLITSQVRLGLAQEWTYRLGALAVPAHPTGGSEAMSYGAVALFAARVQALDDRFAIGDSNVGEVVELCRRLDGAALAIELAAARMPLLGLPRLIASIEQRLRLLTQGHNGAPARQQSLRAALDWSHDLLSPTEQTVFRRLAVVNGSASLAMLLHVLADDDSCGADAMLTDSVVLDALSSLVDRSLLAPVSESTDATAEPRYRLLESPRALASERLQAAGEEPRMQRRHAWAVRALLERTFDALIAGRMGFDEMQQAIAPDLDNAHAALHWALAHHAEQALAIAPLLSLAMGRDRHAECAALWHRVEPLLDATPTAPAALLALAGWQCAEHWAVSRTQHAQARARQAHALAVASGDLRVAHLSLGLIAATSWRLGDPLALRAAVAQVREVAPADWSAYVRAAGAAAEAWLCVIGDDTAGAVHWFEQQARLFRACGIDDAQPLNNIAGIQLAAGDAAAATAVARALVERLSGGRDQYRLAISLVNLSASLLAQDKADEARQIALRSWPLARQFELHPQWADDAALIAALEGRAMAALRLAGFADAAFAALGQPREAVDQVRIDRAVQLAQEALGEQEDPAAWRRWRAEGARLSLDELPGLAFGTPLPA